MDPLPLGRCSDKNHSGNKTQCHRWAILVCSHCNQGICLEHQEIHQQEIQTRAHTLNNRINDLRQILHTLTNQQMMENLQEKIDQWSEKCQSQIVMKHTQMSKQLSSVIQQFNIDQFRSLQLNNIDQSIGQPLTNLLRIPNNIQMKHVETLEQQFENIQKTVQEMTSFIQITEDG